MKPTTLRMFAILSVVSAPSFSACAAGDESQEAESTGEATAALTNPWTFTSGKYYADSHSPNGVDIGDVNGDGFADVVVVNDENNGTSSSVSVRLNDGLGNLGSPTILTGAFRKSAHVKLGKFQSSTTAGHLDIAVHGGDGNGGKVTLFLNDGAGGFGAAQQFPAGYGNQGMSAGDFNNDGKLDVATTGQSNAIVLLGDGLGGLGSKLSTSTDANETGIETGTLDSDGNLDIVTTHASLGQVDVLLGLGDGTFATKATYATGLHTCFNSTTTVATHPEGVVLADYDNDGCEDILTYNSGACTPSEFSLSFLRGQKRVDGTCAGTFAAAVVTGSESGVLVGGAAAADFDGDGNMDIALAEMDAPPEGGHVVLAAGYGDGTFHQGSGKLTLGQSYPIGAIAAGNLTVGGGVRKDLALTSRAAGQVMLKLNAATCGNGIQDANETAVDCGDRCECQGHYLSKLPVSYENNVHMCLGLDDVYYGPGQAMVVDGITYPHGLGMHPPSSTEAASTACPYHQSVTSPAGHAKAAWSLGGGYGTFKARLGIATPECTTMNGVVYRVYGDSTLLYSSPTVSNDTLLTDISVPITGVQTLVLDVDSLADNNCDHAVWAEARVE